MTATESPTRARRVSAPIDPALLSAEQVGTLLNISRSAVFELRRDEVIPAPVRFGGVVRWRAAELRDWVASGCPSMSSWQWQPARMVKLDDYIALRCKLLARVEEELKDAEDRLARGESSIQVQPGRR